MTKSAIDKFDKIAGSVLGSLIVGGLVLLSALAAKTQILHLLEMI